MVCIVARRSLAIGSRLLLAGWLVAPALVYAGEITMARKAELENLVRQDCGSCHGMTLKGGLGRSLLPTDLQHKSVDDISEAILDGLPGTPMPPWRGLLTPKEADWIAKGLKSGKIKRGNQQ